MKNAYRYNMGFLFHEVVQQCPDRTALHFLDGSRWTYKALDVLSNRIAFFFRKRGIKARDVVAIFNEKAAVSYACMLACLKTGVVYTNLDPSSPPDRLRKMMETCLPRLVLAGTEVTSKIAGQGVFDGETVDYKSDFLASLPEDPGLPDTITGIHGNNPAYIMFTSGSTGFPKGAVMSHANLLNFVQWSKTTFELTSEDRLTNLNPLHFDNSVFDFYSSLFSGASMVPVPEDLVKQPRQLLDALNRMGCTVWFSVPSLLVYVLKMRAFKKTDLPSLRQMVFGGEGFPKTQLRALYDLVGDRIQLVNVYGPTECTCICSSYRVKSEDLSQDELLPLGPVAFNFDQLVLNGDEETPDGEIGELCLGGPNVGLGYYRNQSKTSEVFIQNPLHQHCRDIFYRTGDLVRHDPVSRLLHFCGRKDNQVKRMGYRIELEEIECAIGALPYVEENGVIFIRKGDDIGRIVAYVSAKERDEFRLIADLRRQLPPYMIPDRVVFMDHLPKNQNGKIDRRAIKTMEEGQ